MKTLAIEMFDDAEPARKSMLECHAPSFNGSAHRLNPALTALSDQFGMSVHSEDSLLISDDVCGWPALTRYTFSASDSATISAETVFGNRVEEPQKVKNTILLILLLVATFALPVGFLGLIIVAAFVYCILPTWTRNRTNKVRQKKLLDAAVDVGFLSPRVEPVGLNHSLRFHQIFQLLSV